MQLIPTANNCFNHDQLTYGAARSAFYLKTKCTQ